MSVFFGETQAMESTKKHSFKENLEHFWDYHKWKVIIGAFLVVMLGIAFFQSATNAEPDANVMYIGTKMVTAVERDELDASARSFITDLDGDGKKTLRMKELVISAPELSVNDKQAVSYQYNYDVLQSFQAEITAGESVVYIVDESYYSKLKELENDILAPLENVFGKPLENAFEDGYGIYIKYLDFAYLPGFDSLPRESILCIRRRPAEGEVKYNKSDEKYDNNIKFVKELVEYSSPKNYERPVIELVLSTGRKLYSTAQNRIDNSIYRVLRDHDDRVVATVNYREFPLASRTNSAGELEDYLEDDALAELFRIAKEESAIMLLDGPSYAHLSKSGVLTKLSDAVSASYLPKDADSYGARFNRMHAFELDGLCYTDSANGTLMLCLSSAADEQTREAFELLFAFNGN